MIPVILNQSDGKWAFEDLAQMLSRVLWADIKEEIGDLNYVLGIDNKINTRNLKTFIPIPSIELASDKRETEKIFEKFKVKRPRTFVAQNRDRVQSIIKEYTQCSWVLKYPTGCGGMHHRLIEDSSQIPKGWEAPYLLQEFIKSDRPEVYRLYCIDSELFGFNIRRFEDITNKTPWVSHANGAKYAYGDAYGDKPDRKVMEIAKLALIATNLCQSFGVVDLIKDCTGEWYVLEVGTDGIYNYVDRDIENDSLLYEMNERLAKAFWRKLGIPPWGRTWKYKDC